eukprot:scaffold7403_cov277-Pinguiococcus_pyrenoidosus.AAC.10
MPRSKEQDVSVFVRVVGSGMDEAGVEEHALPVLPSSGFVAHLPRGEGYNAALSASPESASPAVGALASALRAGITLIQQSPAGISKPRWAVKMKLQKSVCGLMPVPGAWERACCD